MKEVNPRSQLRSMKLRYFFTVTGLTTGIFLLFNIPAQIVFMILELSPYVKLAVVIILFIADAMIVNRLVNYHWIERWTRAEAKDRGILEAPEPEYVMDDEMVRKLSLPPKLKKPLFSFRKKEKEEEKTDASALMKDAPVSAVPPVKEAEASFESNWRTPFEELETMRIDLVKEEAESIPGDEIEARSEEMDSSVLSSEEKEDTPVTGGRRSERRRQEGKKKEAASRESKRAGEEKEEVPVSSWQTPFDEIPTGNLSSLSSGPSEEEKQEERKPIPEKEEPVREEKRKGLRNLLRKPKEETVLEVKSDGRKKLSETDSRKRPKERRSAEKGSDNEVKEAASSWKVPFDEMPTADLSAVLNSSGEPVSGISAVIAEEQPDRNKRRGLFEKYAEETVIEVHENENISIRRNRKEPSRTDKKQKKEKKEKKEKREKKRKDSR